MICIASNTLLSAGQNEPPVEFHPHRILIGPRDPSVLQSLAHFNRAHKRRAAQWLSHKGNLQVIHLRTNETVESALADYRKSGLVDFAEPDYRVAAASTFPSDPRFQDGTQWWLNNFGQNGGVPDADTDAPEGWDIRRSASNIVVAVIDTGVRLTHEDLINNLWTNPYNGTHGFNALTGNHDPADDNGHGSHVAGNIGATGNNSKGISGIAWNVQIMPCKFLDATANGFNSDAIACIEFARTNGAHVINLSWGGPDFSEALSNAIALARADGILVVAAAGNSSRNIDVTPYYPASIQLDNIVSVGASTRSDTVWNFSNHGLSSVDLFAPGAAIFSLAATSDSAYGSRDGSSMACGIVAGAAALILAQEPGFSYQEVIQRLKVAVDSRPAFIGKCKSGGRLNLRKALDVPRLSLTGTTPQPTLQIFGQPGHQYVLAASSDLMNWVALQTNTASLEGIWNPTDLSATNFPQRFYRAVAAP